jgi:S1-C subfamily serine protease
MWHTANNKRQDNKLRPDFLLFWLVQPSKATMHNRTNIWKTGVFSSLLLCEKATGFVVLHRHHQLPRRGISGYCSPLPAPRHQHEMIPMPTDRNLRPRESIRVHMSKDPNHNQFENNSSKRKRKFWQRRLGPHHQHRRWSRDEHNNNDEVSTTDDDSSPTNSTISIPNSDLTLKDVLRSLSGSASTTTAVNNKVTALDDDDDEDVLARRPFSDEIPTIGFITNRTQMNNITIDSSPSLSLSAATQRPAKRKRKLFLPFSWRRRNDGSVADNAPATTTETTSNAKQEAQKKKGSKSRLRKISDFAVLFVVVLVAAPLMQSEIHDWRLAFQTNNNKDESAASIRRLLPLQGESQLASVPKEKEASRVSEKESASTLDRIPLQEKRNLALSYVTDAVHKVGPAVLRIDTETVQEQEERLAASPHPPGWVQQGQGSGLIFSSEGFILTNAHVVEDATKVTVTLTDGRVYQAQVMGSDEIVDIAVLKIVNGDSPFPVENLPVAELGNSDELNVGQIVIAVGSPGGLDNTVTMGIVSGLERSSTMVGIPHKKVAYIQTDAAINPGNSGGPLVDVESGRVVGINACIRANMEGTSFAIPINRVRALLQDLSEGKQVQHGYLGVSMASCSPDWARQINQQSHSKGGKDLVPEVHGALVSKVFPRTPADQGGLRENDIVMNIGGERVLSSEDARRLIDSAPVGQDMKIVVLRDKKMVTLTVRPVDLATRLRDMRQERQRQMMQERLRFQELAPFRGILQSQ